MQNPNSVDALRVLATHRTRQNRGVTKDHTGKLIRVSSYYGENVFDIKSARGIPESVREEILKVSKSNKVLKKEHVAVVAAAVTEWATSRGATHFCHWFQPLTGLTAQKHDAFLHFKKNDQLRPIEKLRAGQLLQGEPDASSFPHGGSRTTFEARGYTSWDTSSPMFLLEEGAENILCIPTVFISYNTDALDIKTPLLRSISKISEVATEFLHLTGHYDAKQVVINCGAEQEYFLIDKSFFYARPDLVMTGRTLFGTLTAKNQQLSDHYFGTIPERVLTFMQELDCELYRLGVPVKTRHNEVAPGQFEIAPLYTDANLSADHNQIIMAKIQKLARKHDFVALMHEKPFAGLNGSGKHLNWSMMDDTGLNLFEPGPAAHQNYRFLAMVSIVIEAVNRHAAVLRTSIGSSGNDHRLGGHEAPPSILSIFLGDALSKIFDGILSGKTYAANDKQLMKMEVDQIGYLFQDNVDRNRTSPFAFTGNRFEFRAVGSSQAIGFPLSVLNAAVLDVLIESNAILKKLIDGGKGVNEALIQLIKQWLGKSKHIIHNGDGYCQEWLEEAKKRGLPNHKTLPEALDNFKDEKAIEFLVKTGVMQQQEIKTRYNVLLESYIMHRTIEFSTIQSMVKQYIIPSALDYKLKLQDAIKSHKELGLGKKSSAEISIYEFLTLNMDELYNKVETLSELVTSCSKMDNENSSKLMAKELLPLLEEIAINCNELEEIVPEDLWKLPKYFDMLFFR
ncbi:MAG: glutamine synthetase III [Bacteriovoracaceae bacterium]|nr:glutamine synthetase III [Bacteriovoracaceae bacterium]